MNGVQRRKGQAGPSAHTHTRTQKEGEKKSERHMPPNVFCLVIVLFCARQIDKTLATVTKKKRNENSIFNFFIAGLLHYSPYLSCRKFTAFVYFFMCNLRSGS